jgi:glyoxylase I family protein
MIREVIHININVTDIERSLAFYQKLGFEVMHVFGDGGGGEGSREELAQGMGFGGGRVRGAVLSLSDHPRAATKIELLEWQEPAATPQPERSRHQAGVSRIAMRVVDLRAFQQRLVEAGIEFEGDVVDIDIVGAKCFVLFRDPDGTLLELIEF